MHSKKTNPLVLQSLLDFTSSLLLLVSTRTITDFKKVYHTGIIGWMECHIWKTEFIHYGLFLSSTWNIVILTIERFVFMMPKMHAKLFLLYICWFYFGIGTRLRSQQDSWENSTQNKTLWQPIWHQFVYIMKVLGNESSTRWLGQCSGIPIASEYQKFWNMVVAFKVWVSSPTHSILTTQSEIADKVSFIGPHHLPEIFRQNGKRTH